MNDAIRQFHDAIIAAGLTPPDQIIADGKLHRFSTNGKPNDDAGWFVLFNGDLPAGAFGCWRSCVNENWHANRDRDLTAQEQAEYRRRLKEIKAVRDADQQQRHSEAAAKAQQIWSSATPAGDHDYLQRKGITANGARFYREMLVIPIYTQDKLTSLQFIGADGSKRFLTGGEVRGGYYLLGNPDGRLCVVEGFATGASIHKATGHAVAVAFNAGNLLSVAKTWRTKQPDLEIIVCGDDDYQTAGNPGVTKATEAAEAVSGKLAIPQFGADRPAGATDFNDLYQAQGLDAVRQQILDAKQTVTEAKHQATILVKAGCLAVTADKAEHCLLDDGIYQRAGGLVRVVRNPEAVQAGAIRRTAGALVMIPVEVDYVIDRLSRLAKWTKFDLRTQQTVATNPPKQIALTILARRGFWQFSLLAGFTVIPTMRPDGTLLTTPGYDAKTGLLYQPNIAYPPIPAQPSIDDARQALSVLCDVLKDFSFQQPHDRSAALAMILTAVCRRAVVSAPMFIVRAPKMGSGKSLLVDVAAMIATGLPASVMSYSVDGDEMRKRILSVLLQGDPCVALDNIEAPLQGDTLCSVLTQQMFSDRVLGKQKTVSVPTTGTTWFGTGNGLEVVGDMTTRVIPCNLDPQVERPEEREFQRNLYQWIPEHQAKLVTAVLTVARAYVVAGRPRQDFRQFGRFETWSDLVRSALVWLGEPDPTAGRFEVESADPVRSSLRLLLVAWHQAFGRVESSVKEAIAKAQEVIRDEAGTEVSAFPAMAEAVQEIATVQGRPLAQRLGEFIKRHQRRIEAGARFVAAGSYQRAVRWRIEVVDAATFTKECESGESGESVSPSFIKIGNDGLVTNKAEVRPPDSPDSQDSQATGKISALRPRGRVL